jgi:hypothetical protein
MLRIGSNVTLVFYAAHARTPHRAFVQETSLRYFAAAFALALAGCSTLAVERPRDFQAGPIWNQQDAERKCPVVAYAVSGHWNGQWVTTREGEMSVCGIVGESAPMRSTPDDAPEALNRRVEITVRFR